MMNDEQHQKIHSGGFMIATGVTELADLLGQLPDDDEDAPVIVMALNLIATGLDRLHNVVERHHEAYAEQDAQEQPKPQPIQGEQAEQIMTEFQAGLDDFLSSISPQEG